MSKVRLGDLFSISSGGTPNKKNPEYYINGDIPWIKTGDLKGKYISNEIEYITEDGLINSSAKIFPRNTVLVAMYGATIGACSILPFDASTNQACAAFLPNDRVIPEYLYYFLCSKKEKFIQDGVGGAQPNISAGYLKKVEIEELSLNQQKQIAATLDKVTDLINKRQQQLEKLDELVKARFVEMFGGISDSKRYPYKAVKELTDVISGGTPSREVSEYWEGGTIPWVKTTELQNNIITEIDEYVTEAGLDNSSAKLVPAGTVLIAMYGQGKTRGMTGYLGVEACTNQACACILPSDSINQRFLWKFFVLSYDNLRDMAKGGNQPNLNGNIIKNYPVLCPPRELQEQFAAFVEKTDKSKQQIQQSLEKLETLKKSLMKEYFG